MGPSKVITFRSILPALVFIIALNLSYLVLKGPTRNAVLAYGHLWNTMFLAFPLAHVIARRASLRQLGYRGCDPLRLYARGRLWELCGAFSIYRPATGVPFRPPRPRRVPGRYDIVIMNGLYASDFM